MFLSVVHFFNVLIFLDLTLAIIACILLLKVPLRYALKFTLIPLIIFSTYTLLVQGEDLLGRPYDLIPVGEFEYLDYRVVVEDGIKKIELWIVQDKKSRLHLIPYSVKTEQELARAKSKRNKGSRELGKFGFNKKGENDVDSDLSIGDIPIEEILPSKDPNGSEEHIGPEELTPEQLRDRRNSPI